jgi:hypothetical protein
MGLGCEGQCRCSRCLVPQFGPVWFCDFVAMVIMWGLGCGMFWGLPRGIRQMCERVIFVVVLSIVCDVWVWGSGSQCNGLPTGPSGVS